ncbi:hypothetical protein E2I00_007977 [Balaenoptera physalus]|uniref:Uncharacterized protein n=1 Tax=Balaenoptera physalus TaxID=9770 RepID=A0A643BYE1_BALPH|nr:hypothetical protein E2I00_007977 [Balaenoptera physalus]
MKQKLRPLLNSRGGALKTKERKRRRKGREDHLYLVPVAVAAQPLHSSAPAGPTFRDRLCLRGAGHGRGPTGPPGAREDVVGVGLHPEL